MSGTASDTAARVERARTNLNAVRQAADLAHARGIAAAFQRASAGAPSGHTELAALLMVLEDMMRRSPDPPALGSMVAVAAGAIGKRLAAGGVG